MTFTYRGEFEVESGLGLPRRTTLERLAYVPSADGYVVFDTNLKKVAVWDATGSTWEIIADVASFLEKIDVVDGIAKNKLTLNSSTDVELLSLEAGVSAGGFQDPLSMSDNLNTINLGTVVNNGDSSTLTSTNGDGTFAFSILNIPLSTGKVYFRAIQQGTPTNGVIGVMITEDSDIGSIDFTTYNPRGLTNLGVNLVSVTSGAGVYIPGTSTAVTTGIPSFSSGNATIDNKLDLDTGLWEISINGAAYITALPNIYTYVTGPIRLGLSVNKTYAMDLLYGATDSFAPIVVPVGFVTPGDLVGGSTALITSPVNELNVGTSDTGFNFTSLFTETLKPVRGIDDVDPTSLTTKGYVDSIAAAFKQNFVVGDWVTTSGVSTYTITAATHGISYGVEDLLETKTYQLAGGILVSVTIGVSINDATGDITLTTRGEPFAGRIIISR
jgi:hypothetical protein